MMIMLTINKLITIINHIITSLFDHSLTIRKGETKKETEENKGKRKKKEEKKTKKKKKKKQ